MVERRLVRFAILVAVALIATGSGCLEQFQDQFGRAKTARTGPGDNAADLLSSSKYSKLIVEIDSVEGSGPNAEALSRLKAAIAEHLDKPGGVTYDTSGRVPGRGGTAKYSFEEIDSLEEKHRDHYPSGDTMTLYVIYLDGGSTEDTDSGRVLGAAYHGSSLVMFKGNIRSITRADGSLSLSGKAEERCVERAVFVHELGHALGLVGDIPMVTPHEDSAHPGHSSNKNSVMYYAVENSQSIFNIFGSGCSDIPYQFDSNDKADMKAAGGK